MVLSGEERNRTESLKGDMIKLELVSANMYAFELWVEADHCGRSTREHVI